MTGRTQRPAASCARRAEILGAPLDAVTLYDLVDEIDRVVVSRGSMQHSCVNAGKLVRIGREPELAAALAAADVVTADGMAVVWAARLLGHTVPERLTGIDLMEALFELAAQRGYRVYLLGARPDAVAEAAAVARRRHPRLVIAGYHHGYFTADEEREVVAGIAASDVDMLFVAMETPQKEIFLERNRDLRIPFSMGVGGAFDVLAGRRRRAPVWAQRTGLEWLFRLLQEPRRLGRRYVVGNAAFVMLVLRAVARRRLTRTA